MQEACRSCVGGYRTLLLERNVIFPTVLIARDVISNSRQSSEIYRRYLTWFRFMVRRVVRRGVICDHNSPLNVAPRMRAQDPVFSSSLLPPRVRLVSLVVRSPAFLFSPQTSGIYEHIFHVSRSKLARDRSIPERAAKACQHSETSFDFTL